MREKTDTCEFCGKTRPARGKGTKNTDFNYAVHMCDDCYCNSTYGSAEEKAAYLKSIGRDAFEPIPSILKFHRMNQNEIKVGRTSKTTG